MNNKLCIDHPHTYYSDSKTSKCATHPPNLNTFKYLSHTTNTHTHTHTYIPLLLPLFLFCCFLPLLLLYCCFCAGRGLGSAKRPKPVSTHTPGSLVGWILSLIFDTELSKGCWGGVEVVDTVVVGLRVGIEGQGECVDSLVTHTTRLWIELEAVACFSWLGSKWFLVGTASSCNATKSCFPLLHWFKCTPCCSSNDDKSDNCCLWLWQK